MSRLPIRIAQPPPPNQQRGQMNTPRLSDKSYDELLKIAEQQRRLIDANQHRILQHDYHRSRIDNAPIRSSLLRNQVYCEEREMGRLKAIERSARETRQQRLALQKQLQALQSTYTSKQEHLRSVISRLTSLRTQLDVLYHRRLTALSAARNQQKLLSAQRSSAMGNSSKIPSHSMHSPINESVMRAEENTDQETIADSSVYTTKSVNNGHRLRASIEPFQISNPKPTAEGYSEVMVHNLQQPFKSTDVIETIKSQTLANDNASRDMSPSPPKDPYPTGSTDELDRSSQQESVMEKPKDFYRARYSNYENYGEYGPRKVETNSSADVSDCNVESISDAVKLNTADQISIRPDTLRAAKRRSWALQEATSDEAEYVRKVLCEEQKKGRTHLVLGHDLGNLFSAAFSKAAIPFITKSEEQEKITADDSKEYEAATDESQQETDDHLLEEKSFDKVERRSDDDDETSYNACFSDDSVEINRIVDLLKPAPEKGILRKKGANSNFKTVMFDPLALLLDAALEGEIDLVKTSASQLDSISASNDEGITALHNAICAGHYEIVKFLVESSADVNAQDSDGWTPLHCAASCNNLPMVKLLVENGACIFAQTISDLETPADKCEADEDGYEGCQLYLEAAQKGAGVVNNRYMYAAYSYNAQRDDELSIVEGARLVVIEKSVDGQTWWLCDIANDETEEEWSSNGDTRGLVPRNYLALYPPLPLRQSDFVVFELPQTVAKSLNTMMDSLST